MQTIKRIVQIILRKKKNQSMNKTRSKIAKK